MGMYELRLGPAHGLKQAVDYTFTVTYPPEYGIQATDAARMSLRRTLDDPAPTDLLSTSDGRLLLTTHPDGSATITVKLTGETSTTYPITQDGTSLYRKLKQDEVDGLTDPGTYRVLPLIGTLIVTSAGQQDRPGPIDLQLLFEASATREMPEVVE